jgi:hypothetical protein
LQKYNLIFDTESNNTMTTSQPSSRDISRKLVALIFGANFFGALIIFLYFSVIDPLPVGGVAFRSLETEDIVTFGIAGVVIFVGAFAIISRLGRPIRNWLRLIEAGTPASELPSSVARLVLIWPLIGASLVAATGLLVAIFFSIRIPAFPFLLATKPIRRSTKFRTWALGP